MFYPVVIIHESKDRLANRLRAKGNERRWVLRQPRDTEECRAALPPGSPVVLVLEVGSAPAKLLEFMNWVHRHRPETAMLVVLQTEDGVLAQLAYEFGATQVIRPAGLLGELHEVVEQLIDRQWRTLAR